MVENQFESGPSPRNYDELSDEQKQIHDQDTLKSPGIKRIFGDHRIKDETTAYEVAHVEKPFRDIAHEVRQEVSPESQYAIIENLKHEANLAIRAEQKELERSAREFANVTNRIISLASEREETLILISNLKQEQIAELFKTFGVNFSKRQRILLAEYAPSQIPGVCFYQRLDFVSEEFGYSAKESEKGFIKLPEIYSKLLSGEKIS